MERSSNNLKFRSEAGYSLMEVMIGIGLISAAAFLIATFSTTYNSTHSAARRACESYTDTVISMVKEDTPYRQILTMSPSGADTTRMAPAFSAGSRGVPAPADYGPVSGAPLDSDPFMIMGTAFTTVAGGVRPNNFQLIQGSIRTLSTIYNRTPAVRCQLGAYPTLTTPSNDNLPLPTFLATLPGGVTIQMRIEPYRISTGDSLCPAGLTQLFPGPLGIAGADADVYADQSGTPTSVAAIAKYNTMAQYDIPAEMSAGFPMGSFTAANQISVSNPVDQEIATRALSGPITVGDPDLGLRMSVQMAYALEGQNYTCSSSQNFEYPADRTPPPAPNLVRIVRNTSQLREIPATPEVQLTRAHDHCAADTLAGLGTSPTGGLTIEVGYQNTSGTTESGVQFVCKDLSWIRRPTTGTAGFPTQVASPMAGLDGIPCVTKSGGDPEPSGSMPIGMPRTPAPVMTHLMSVTNNLQYHSTMDPLTRVRNWVSCERLTVCGQMPTTVTTNNPGNPDTRSYTLRYEGLPNGCHANFEAVAVDTAGNRSISTPDDPNVAEINSSGFLKQDHMATLTTVLGPYAYRMNEIYRPTCGPIETASPMTYGQQIPGLGIYCPPQANWASLDPTIQAMVPNGYYTCRKSTSFGVRRGDATSQTGSDGCCVGPDCRPWN